MKNIYVLPTDKPSKLYLWNSVLEIDTTGLSRGLLYQNIYITSDEEIKEGDWVFDTFKNACPIIRQLTTEEVLEVQTTEFKIILTTDKDLIKDGVQAINDEFLEWFVKNSSCEEVGIEKDSVMNDRFILNYKIIIPKEEPKQGTTKTSHLDILNKVEWISMMHKQNLNGRETEDELFEAGILAGIKESYMEEEVDVLISLLKTTTEYEVLQSFRDKVKQFKKK